jgi:hypothetical protein
MNVNLENLVTKIASAAEHEQFFALSEGLVKVRTIEAALSLGWTVQDGASGKDVVHTLWLDASEVKIESCERVLKIEDGSADVYITAPIKMMLEIKTRPDFGSKAQAQFSEMLEDVDRVAGLKDTAFLFVFDPKLYRSFSGDKQDKRGRKALSSEWFVANFAKYEDVKKERRIASSCVVGDEKLELLFMAVGNGMRDDRVIVAGTRADSMFGLATGD